MTWGRRMATFAIAGTMTLAACSSGPGYDNQLGDAAFAGSHGDAHNSANSSIEGSRALKFAWSRPIGAPVASGLAIAPEGLIYTTARTKAGCNVFAFQIESGRKKFCNKISPASFASRPISDAANNIYVGDDGAVLSFADYGPARWRTELTGSPVGSQFTPDGHLLVVTQLGEISVLNRYNGTRFVPSLKLAGDLNYSKTPDVPEMSPTVGLDSCISGGKWCLTSTVPAIDLPTGRVIVTFWRPNTPEASVVSLKYTSGDKPGLKQEWSVPVLSKGTAVSPVISPDGKTVYVADNSGKLRALDAATGSTKWSHDLGFIPQYGLSLQDGLIVPGGSEGHLVAIRDAGKSAEVAWERKDVELRGAPVLAAGGTGYIVARDGDTGLALVTFDVTSGKTVDHDALPGATGTTLATSIGPDKQVVVVTIIGELFTFAP
ncbi:PQQ-binding-like beta-propeller repeat protein [Smaragdicoccus niigatensis]|uniref:outer membrane protein assembly factor BamB family protein n=1 Tax=Smaragdicoccus niigatensis TaxID=359359 RepID=UPI0012DF0E45|nr:PQQ-binding-like beta-propeller repeat protein [Smaragdicoccus niigatensis]